MTLTAQKLPHLPFLTELSHETAARRPLAQPSRHFGPLRSLSLCCGANFVIARATLSLWACQIALVVARCNFGIALGVPDHSHCGAVRVLGSLAQPFWHFGRARSLSLRRGAQFDNQGDLAQRSWQGGLF